MILDSMLPNQCLQFRSADPKFCKLINHVTDGESGDDDYGTSGSLGELGMIGFNPHTGRPLNLGVTASISCDSIESTDKNDGNEMMTVTIRGKKCFEIQGQPWLDDTKSFYMADVEIIEDREDEEKMSAEQIRDMKTMSKQIPDLVQEWISLVIGTGKSDEDGMAHRMGDIGSMPEVDDNDDSSLRQRALWTAALINPLPALGVCLEIRPAMLAFRNDYERIKLASEAIRSSIDHMSGDRKSVV